MRLLHASTLELIPFLGQDVPRYAILSHTWGEDEFIFEDLQDGIQQHMSNPKRGLRKIIATCKQAIKDGWEYVWVDTCCIDKSSSAELSEAINSMFKWYKNSAACYAFMEDVTLEADGTMTNFDTSRWFTRGWTLQELIAPHGLEFFDRDWNQMSSRHKLADRLVKITGVSRNILLRLHMYQPGGADPKLACSACGKFETLPMILSEESIAGKMKWAANRTTTKDEDMAYCLMGLFSINMPLLYGEGMNAFPRLQDEIMRSTPDQTMLTWTELHVRNQSPQRLKPYLPKMPSAFQLDVYNRDASRLARTDMVSTPRGLEIDVLLVPCTTTVPNFENGADKLLELQLAVLSCAIDIDYLSRVAIFVSRIQPNDPAAGYVREHNEALVILKPGAEPTLVGSLAGYAGISIANGTVKCDVESFEPRIILLPNIQPRTMDLDSSPQLQLEVRSADDWQFRANASNYMEENVLHRQSSPFFSKLTAGNIVLEDVLFFSNLESGFFVLWGVQDADQNLPMPFRSKLVCWIESWDSYLGDGYSETAVPDVTYDTLRFANHDYAKKFENAEFPCTASEISGVGFHAQASIVPCKFLGRVSYKLLIEIQSTSATKA